jgi:DUF4097 and DUF4098 domain-containing protein YvlB
VALDIAVSKGNVTIAYSRDGQVSICASAQDASGKDVSMEVFESTLTIEQAENHITIRKLANPDYADLPLSISYNIGVPFRTEVNSTISGVGNQRLMGITGPAKLITSIGDINASYVRFGLVHAQTAEGKITCTRVAQVEAETGSGNITLLEDGPSKAIVRGGPGKIEVGGARGRFEGSTDKGELHIRAVLWDEWQLTSISGNIRIELPPRAKFEVDVTTSSGEIWVERPDMDKPDAAAHQCHQKVNGGDKRIQVRTDSGRISIE